MKGVTLANFRRYVQADATKDDLRKISDEQVATVDRRYYWDAVAGAQLPDGVDYATFDYAVNSGPGRAAKYLQSVAGVKEDGKIGPATLKAVKGLMRATVINDLCDKRMAFLKGLKTWKTFGKGWTARVSSVRTDALKMAAQPTPENPTVIEKTVHVPVAVDQPVVPKTIEKAVKKQTNGWGWSGIGLGGAGAALTAIAGWPWQTIALFAGLGVAGGIVALVIGPWIVGRVKTIRAAVEG
ncbi:glycoside hydrolase family 108 protein [Mesorhizobium sp. A623]